ncbi:hypothetical protein Rleg4DRAFT_6047 [Rhizobium leguminosarum bv. trifolii WSM2297]|uniref:Uncharacterized protein n=1 Tax=Rhizobium leguminosarum bv. trifolii WSM2297 TaxID=754762 RepID=J0CKK2_RHILT|nr:hypothetical protein Rleg4DRAFT_6047 [Rhizobium leguminosarum bv. trifolii WSM2297]
MIYPMSAASAVTSPRRSLDERNARAGRRAFEETSTFTVADAAPTQGQVDKAGDIEPIEYAALSRGIRVPPPTLHKFRDHPEHQQGGGISSKPMAAFLFRMPVYHEDIFSGPPIGKETVNLEPSPLWRCNSHPFLVARTAPTCERLVQAARQIGGDLPADRHPEYAPGPAIRTRRPPGTGRHPPRSQSL